jgi:hypothetical protein
MALDFVQERHQAHAYLDRLPPEQLSAVLSCNQNTAVQIRTDRAPRH